MLPFSFLKRKFSPVSFLIRVYLGLPPDPDTPPPLSHLGEGVSPKAFGAPCRCRAGTWAGLGAGAAEDWQTAPRAASSQQPEPKLGAPCGPSWGGGGAGGEGGDIKGAGTRGGGAPGARGPELIRQSPVLPTSMFRLLSEEKIRPLRSRSLWFLPKPAARRRPPGFWGQPGREARPDGSKPSKRPKECEGRQMLRRRGSCGRGVADLREDADSGTPWRGRPGLRGTRSSGTGQRGATFAPGGVCGCQADYAERAAWRCCS